MKKECTVTKYDVAKSFLYTNYKDLIRGVKIPPLKFIFNEETFKLFDEIDIYRSNSIRNNNKLNEEELNDEILINIPDGELFFEKLAKLVELYIELDNKYDPDALKSSVLKSYLDYGLWIKMTPQDFYDIYGFLDRQISSINNTKYLDESIKKRYIGDYYESRIYARNELNSMCFETYSHVEFELLNANGESYDLPSVHYDIYDNNGKKECNILGLQNMFMGYFAKSKKIERKLYKMNKGVETTNIHPGFVLSIELFLDILKKNNIDTIKIPLLQVFNYGYHEILSRDEKLRFNAQWTESYLESVKDDIEEMKMYEDEKKFYDRVVDKEDFISKSKVENLANLILRIKEQFDDIDIDIEEYCISVKLKEKDDLKILSR